MRSGVAVLLLATVIGTAGCDRFSLDVSPGASASGVDLRGPTGLRMAGLVRKVIVPTARDVDITVAPDRISGTFALPNLDGAPVDFRVREGVCPNTTDATLIFSGIGFQIGSNEYRLPIDADGTQVCLTLASVNPTAMENYIIEYKRGFGDRFGINWVLSEIESARQLASIRLTRRRVDSPPPDVELPYFETMILGYTTPVATKDPILVIGSYESVDGPNAQSAQITRSTKGFMREFARVAGDHNLQATKVTAGVVTIRRDF